MSFEMKVPTVGESISEVTIARWNKKDGDVVKLDELLCELESDKATFELTSQAACVAYCCTRRRCFSNWCNYLFR